MKFMDQPPLCPARVACPNPACVEPNRIGIHHQTERRYICHGCGKTFAATQGTPLNDLKYPLWVVELVLTLLAYGCPVPAIVAAFVLDERTVASWQRKAGHHGEGIQDRIVCNGQVELLQVQADEVCINTQHGKVWMATVMTVFSRLFLWGEVATHRNKALIERVMAHVHAAASGVQAVLFAVDGFAAYPKAILKYFYTPARSGQRGRPRHVPWPNLHIAQVVKHRTGQALTAIERRVVHGCRSRIYDLIAISQCGFGLINTAYIERLNATCRARMPALTRRTRNRAQTTDRVRAEMFWTGVVYNFCTVHHSLAATPAVAAGLTDHTWSISELLLFRPPPRVPK